MIATVIKLGSPEADKLGVTKELFQSAIGFDSSPRMYYITLCVPFPDRKEAAYNNMLSACDKLKTPTTIEASDQTLRNMAADRGWKTQEDPAGTITVTNAKYEYDSLLKLLWQ